MFAFIASRDISDHHRQSAALAQLGHTFGVSDKDYRRVSLAGFHLDFFDTACEIEIYKDDRFLILLAGTLLKKDKVQKELRSSSSNAAELVFRMYNRGKDALQSLDGHMVFFVFDSRDTSITIVADRFHRYSVVYTACESVYVSSHTYLLHAVTAPKYLDMESFSQAIHFRWLTGQKKLFKNMRQVLPGSIVKIDQRTVVEKDKYFAPEFAREETLNVEHWAQEVDLALDACLRQIAKRHKVIGVPLSGGVDSSLLLAKAQEHFRDCIAVTACFKNGDNPELENARKIAEIAGVRHIIADIDDDYIRKFFPEIVRLHEQPPRNFSDIALARSLDALRGEADAFLYGEGADTYFGLGVVHDVIEAERLTAPFRLIPGPLRRSIAKIIPERGYRLRRLKKVLAEGIDSLIFAIEKIPYVTPPWEVFPCARTPVFDPELNDHLDHASLPTGDRAAIQLLATGVMNHIENTGSLASFYGLTMYAPFVLNDVRAVAERLPIGMQKQNGAYKLVLRELACRYFDRKYIYSDKFGFPTPTQNWLKGPLKERVDLAKSGLGIGRDYYSARALSSLTLDEDFEHFWFAICLDELFEQLDAQIEKLRVAA